MAGLGSGAEEVAGVAGVAGPRSQERTSDRGSRLGLLSEAASVLP